MLLILILVLVVGLLVGLLPVFLAALNLVLTVCQLDLAPLVGVVGLVEAGVGPVR